MAFAWEMTGYLARAGLLLGLVGLSAPLHGADSGYLNQLKNEAASTQVDQEEADGPADDSRESPASDTTRPLSGHDNYLQGLTSEAGTTRVDDSGQIVTRDLEGTGAEVPSESAWDIDSQSLDVLRAGLERGEFEALLKQNYYASYVFYKKLDPTSKSLVYKTYLKSPAIGVVRNQIISLSK
ncbi:hypothetical protein [Thiohalophilus thiocyanatoxydans]|uniref:Uncharacterized protein n=1 Tax=Thiohalophilus thiocyanatoxydans TaxID=381308 RepID=A0A4R8J1Z6_9GAMM|nr:hypothetical protein [Thiohalophilus thiocyanatoxydans]TDY04219.1 hypothetical protein EDC23_0592 [Thiohalophilus thiocyanatoxydans]